MNYSELLDNVRNYTEVDSEVLSNSVINVFITNAENKIQKQLDLDAFRKFATSSLTIGSPFLTMPEDFDFERGVHSLLLVLAYFLSYPCAQAAMRTHADPWGGIFASPSFCFPPVFF